MKVLKSGLVETPDRPVMVKRYKARGKYRVVDGTAQFMVEPSSPEVRSED